MISAYAKWLIAIASSNTLAGQAQSYVTSDTAPTIFIGASKMTDDSLFQQVPLDTSEQTLCSPEDPGLYWRGVVIRSPSRVVLPEETSQYSSLIIPICGLYLVDVANAIEYPGPKILVISDEISGKIYKGELVKRIPEPTIPPPSSPRIKSYKNTAFGSYFNVNAAAYVTIPMQAARYRMKIEYAGYRSNEVTIEIVERSE